MRYFVFSIFLLTLSACSRCQSSSIDKAADQVSAPIENNLLQASWLHLNPDHESTLEDIPQHLSETGIFSSVKNLKLIEAFHPYELNIPFWSDSAEKFRWFFIPEGEKIEFSTLNHWKFPVGSVFVKHFEIDLDQTSTHNERTRLETRILMKANKGWTAYTYKWNDSQTDAELSLFWTTKKFEIKLSNGTTKPIEWVFPGRDDCFTCHGLMEPKILGAKTAQFNRNIELDGKIFHQLEAMEERKLFSTALPPIAELPKYPKLQDTKHLLSERARAYLDINCASCHYSGGMADLDLSITADFSQVINREPDPDEEELVIPGGKIILPGNKEKSLVWVRMGRTDYHRMPTISSNVIDEEGMALIGEWIDRGAE